MSGFIRLSNFPTVFTYWKLFQQGIIVTILLSLFTVMIGFVLALVLALMRMSDFRPLRALGLDKNGHMKEEGFAAFISRFNPLAFLATFLLNELYYIPGGRFLPYFSWLGVLCFVISNLTVLLPMILSKGRRMGKADVTEF